MRGAICKPVSRRACAYTLCWSRRSRAGIEDGSVRASAGQPLLIALTLWGFMHGIIQVAKTKQIMLDAHGVASSALIEAGLDLATQSIAAERHT